MIIPTLDLTDADWHKSGYSNNGGNCVEVAPGYPGVMPVRDSKAPNGPALIFAANAWESFVTAVRSGEFGEV
ncbi:DUF397 domain-containing protein [Kitasatospora sp. NPDC057512]|uniref:DUF397 domain-containing protein n=1 Tax=Kitasatospora sp. NPDC057512 TaxID=3346154 RepID=UPI0036D04754